MNRAPGPAAKVRAAAASLTRKEWTEIGGMTAVVALLHGLGWGILLALALPHRGTGGGLALGVGITAYTLGLRHAFDADHISAIDNTTRKLMADGQRPLSVGLFFSLGHSTIVFALAVLFAVGVHALAGPVENSGSALHTVTGFIGTLVSGTFLYLIAAVNLMILIGILRVFRDMRGGELDEAGLEDQLNNRGFMNRLFSRATRAVSRPWQMYPVGALFGLGFDTASEVALLILAATAAASGLPWYGILCLPLLFAAGMSLLDSVDGSFMNFAYGWAFSKPVRKIYYNIAVTGLSVAVALIIGTVELMSIVADRLQLNGGVWRLVANVDLNTVGYGIVGLFVVTWVVAFAVWRLGRIEERWSANVQRSPAE